MEYNTLADELFSSMAQTSKLPFQQMPHDYSKGEMGILVYLTRLEEGVTSGELSDGLNISTGRVASALNNLEKKNMIRRSRDKSDRRRVIVNITEQGRKTLAKKRAQGVSCAERILENIGKEDAGEFVRIMKKIIKTL